MPHLHDKCFTRGFAIEVETWENDADNYKIENMYGLSKEQAIFIVRACELFKQDSPHSNLYNPEEKEISDLADAFFQVWKDSGEPLKSELVDVYSEINADNCLDFFCQGELNTLGIFHGGDFYTRVVDKIHVFYLPEDVRFENVDEEFGL